jgi:hypothetical protein
MGYIDNLKTEIKKEEVKKINMRRNASMPEIGLKTIDYQKDHMEIKNKIFGLKKMGKNFKNLYRENFDKIANNQEGRQILNNMVKIYRIDKTLEAIEQYEKKSIETKKNLEQLVMDHTSLADRTERKYKYVMINKFY